MDRSQDATAEALASRLQAAGIQPTAQRLRIARILLARAQHLTAEQLLEQLRARGERVSKATVYNTLNLFAERGVLRQVWLGEGSSRFDSNVEAHFHLYHVESGELIDLPLTAVRFEDLPPPPEGMEYAGVDLTLRVRRRPAPG